MDHDDAGRALGGALPSNGTEAVARSYAALICRWEGTVVSDRRAGTSRARALIERLCWLGVEVIVIAESDITAVGRQLNARPRGPGHLHLCASNGSEVVEVDGDGPRLLHRQRSHNEEATGPEVVAREKGQAMRWALNYLAERGVGAGLMLIAGDQFGSVGAGEGRDVLLCPAGTERATVVSVGAEPGGVPLGVVHHGGGPRGMLGILRKVCEHLERRIPDIDGDPEWVLRLPVREGRRQVDESLASLSDGRFGTRGVLEEQPTESAPVVICGGVYDGSDTSQHLLQAPTWTVMRIPNDVAESDEIALDLRTGVVTRQRIAPAGGFHSVRFVSLAHSGLMAVRAEAVELGLTPPLRIPAGSISQQGRIGTATWARVGSSAGGGVAVAVTQRRGRTAGRLMAERRALYVSDPSQLPSATDAAERLAETAGVPLAALISQHRAAWGHQWGSAQIDIPDDPTMQFAARFALFHLLASVPAHGEAAVGARGLSGSGYAGHVFWDADVFVLPVLAATHPGAARAMLEYRLRRLPAARAHAAATGGRGARFPWESARDGADVTPRIGYVGGMPQPIRTGQDEEHIVADVAWAANHYATWTGDAAFLAGPGADLIIDTARYWASRVRFDDAGRCHLYGVEGPDEYHAPVDDNAYTNVMARWNLNRAVDLAADGAMPIDGGEVDTWRTAASALVDGYDAATGRYEQFTGYNRLDSVLVSTLGPPPLAADLLLGAERIAATQVIKQPDVLMLHHLVPGEVVEGSLEPNLAHYGPRTAHGSSLSPAIHAALLARAGHADQALEWLRLAARLDLDDLTATTATGLHLATLGGIWQALVFGFAGVRADGAILRIHPRLPASWSVLGIRLFFRGSRVHLRVGHDQTVVTSEHPLLAAGTNGRVLSGHHLTLPTR